MDSTSDPNAAPSALRCSTSPHPIGIMPKRIWIRLRFWDLARACNRYMRECKPVPEEWKAEMREHLLDCDEVTKDIEPEVMKEWQMFLRV